MPFVARSLLPVLTALPAIALGQAPAPVPPDPYTGGSPAVLDRLGYSTLGPFAWGDAVSTTDIDALLGQSLRWVETEHFKIGSGLETWTLQGSTRERRKIQTELAGLANTLPAIRTRTRRLDPWLRLHLFADRAERLYADFAARVDKRELGCGELLGPIGERGKFCLLLLQRQSDLGRYLRRYLRPDAEGPLCHSFHEAGSRVFVTCAERKDGELMNDTALHCEIVYGSMLNMLASCTAGHDSPLWWREGLCHWYQRRVDPRYDSVTLDEQPMPRMPHWNWGPRVRMRTGSGAYPDAAATLGWRVMSDLGRSGHMFAWSRVDFLMAEKSDGLSRFLYRMRHQRLSPSRATASQNVEWHSDAMLDAFGLTLAQFDKQWLEFVHGYPRR